jgi:hypothetical protein
MKPRLLSAPLTQIDDYIKTWLVWRSRPELDRDHLDVSDILADRRDADLMLDLTLLTVQKRDYKRLRRFALKSGAPSWDWPE